MCNCFPFKKSYKIKNEDLLINNDYENLLLYGK